MARTLPVVFLLATLVSGATHAAPADDDHSFRLLLARGSRLLIEARVNGRAVTALLDSAAEATMLDAEFAKTLKLGHGQAALGQGSGSASFAATLVRGVTLEALGLRLPDQTVAVADLGDVGQRLLGHRIDAILGREIFDAARLSIDVDAGRIAVVSRDTEPPGVALELTTEHGVETIPVEVESSGPVRATFDLGNGSRVLIGSKLAARLRLLDDGRSVTTDRGGGLGGELARQVVTLGSLKIAGRTLVDVPAAIDTHASASDANVGIAVLRRFRITTDFAQHRVWLAPRD